MTVTQVMYTQLGPTGSQGPAGEQGLGNWGGFTLTYNGVESNNAEATCISFNNSDMSGANQIYLSYRDYYGNVLEGISGTVLSSLVTSITGNSDLSARDVYFKISDFEDPPSFNMYLTRCGNVSMDGDDFKISSAQYIGGSDIIDIPKK